MRELLTAAEAKQYVRIAKDAVDVATPADFSAWIKTSVHRIFPANMLAAGTVSQAANGSLDVSRLLTAGFPLAFFQAVTKREGRFFCPTMESWFRERYPQLIQLKDQRTFGPEFQTFDLVNVAAHGLFDSLRQSATYFSFSQVEGPLTKRHAELLDLLMPLLYRAYQGALVGVRQETRSSAGISLTRHELEVLNWIGLGKSCWEIAQIRNRSVNTVRNQTRALLFKMQCNNKAQLISRSAELGILGVQDRR